MNILCVIPMTEEQRARLAAAAEGSEIIHTSAAEVTEEQVRAADIILGNVPAKLIGASPRLKLLQLNSAGTDAYIAPGMLSPDTVLCNATGAYGRSVAEHCFAMALMLMKHLHLYRDDQNACRWRDEGAVRSIEDMTVVITGAGDIGARFGRLCSALGARTIGVCRRPRGKTDGLDEIVLSDRLREVLPKADIIANFLPGTPETRHIFDTRAFAAMKPGAIFVNGGRGGSVDTDALTDALRSGRLEAAGLDVFEQEPLPKEHPLWKLPNALITPHVAGGFHMASTLETIVEIAIRNTAAVTAGRQPENIVDMETGYRR